MSELVEIIESYRYQSLVDEDGNDIGIELVQATIKYEISNFEVKNRIELPSELKKLLLLSDGLLLFGIKILSLAEMEFFPSEGILSFHSWGNGDFDCLSVGVNYPIGTIFFMSHSEENITKVNNTMQGWFKEVISEIKKNGTLLHPLDYNHREAEGMYKIYHK